MSAIRRSAYYCSMLLACSLLGFSQQQPGSGSPSLYSKALFASIDEMARAWGHIDDSYGNKVRTDYNHVIVEKTEITEELPVQSDKYHIEYLNAQELVDRYRTLHKEFAILVVHPMRNENGYLKINIAVYWFKYEKRRSYYALEGGSETEFHYDCENQNWILDQVKLWGV